MTDFYDNGNYFTLLKVVGAIGYICITIELITI